MTLNMKRKQGTSSEALAGRSQKRSKPSKSRIFEKLSEELCFHCLSDLGCTDLIAVSETSKYLTRLANDNQVSKPSLCLPRSSLTGFPAPV